MYASISKNVLNKKKQFVSDILLTQFFKKGFRLYIAFI